MTTDVTDGTSLTDAELTELALAADPDEPLGPDAVSLWELTGARAEQSLPEWYMPAPVGGVRPLHGWRRRAAYAVIVSLLMIVGTGLCNTYGQLASG